MKSKTMKAIIATAYGEPSVLQVQDRSVPVPKDHEVLIKVHHSPVTAADGLMRKGVPRFARFFLGWLRPKNPIPGTGFAGQVVGLRKLVRQFVIGDEVFRESGVGFSAHAENTGERLQPV